MAHMFDKDIKFNSLVDKHNIELWESQEEHVKLALFHALQTGVSKSIYQQFKNSPKGIWNNLVDHYLSTKSSRVQLKKIIDKLQNLNIREYDTRVEFGTKLTQFIAQYNDVSIECLSSNNYIAYFENSIKSDSTVTTHFNSWKLSYRLTKNKDHPEFKDYKAEMLWVLLNIDLQQPQRGKPLTQSINVMNQNYDYDSDNHLDTVYNALFVECKNIDKQTMVEVMQALRRTGKPTWRKKPNPNAMLAPKTWKKAPPEFKRL